MTKTEFKRLMRTIHKELDFLYSTGASRGICILLDKQNCGPLLVLFRNFFSDITDDYLLREYDEGMVYNLDSTYNRRKFVLYMFEAEILNSDVLEGL